MISPVCDRANQEAAERPMVCTHHFYAVLVSSSPTEQLRELQLLGLRLAPQEFGELLTADHAVLVAVDLEQHLGLIGVGSRGSRPHALGNPSASAFIGDPLMAKHVWWLREAVCHCVFARSYFTI